MITPLDIIEFWYSERMSKTWFSATPAVDQEIRDKYATLWERAASGKLDEWQNSPEGCLALIIVLDQFPLNMYRGQEKSFATERRAVEVAWHAVKNNVDQRLKPEWLSFLYMPFMHSEFISEQNMAVNLFREAKLYANLEFAENHREIIRKFGRFPHRNKILNRDSTKEEIEYLNSSKAF